ncbi:MAG: hypothetical protein DMF34_06350 [Verrucomicrobia bacterium]|nr:MAG: hypothetical protein DMF34_06350 [Verrucomicrobiota bacterium]
MADNYITAALLSFYLPGQPETFVPGVKRPLNQLELWSNYDQRYPTGNALIVAKRPTFPHALGQSFAHLTPLGPVEAIDGQRMVGRYYLFLGQRNRESDHY